MQRYDCAGKKKEVQKLDMVFQTWSNEWWVMRNNHFPWSTEDVDIGKNQDVVCLYCCQNAQLRWWFGLLSTRSFPADLPPSQSVTITTEFRSFPFDTRMHTQSVCQRTAPTVSWSEKKQRKPTIFYDPDLGYFLTDYLREIFFLKLLLRYNLMTISQIISCVSR